MPDPSPLTTALLLLAVAISWFAFRLGGSFSPYVPGFIGVFFFTGLIALKLGNPSIANLCFALIALIPVLALWDGWRRRRRASYRAELRERAALREEGGDGVRNADADGPMVLAFGPHGNVVAFKSREAAGNYLGATDIASQQYEAMYCVDGQVLLPTLVSDARVQVTQTGMFDVVGLQRRISLACTALGIDLAGARPEEFARQLLVRQHHNRWPR